MAKSPIGKSMPIDLEEFFGSPIVQQMKDFQRWWYMSLLMNEWRNTERPGYLPNDHELLWMLAGAPSKEQFEKHGAIVMKKFDASEDGLWLSNKKLLEVFERQSAKYNKWAQNGYLGGRPKTKPKPSGNQTKTSDFDCESVSEVVSGFEVPTGVPEKAWMAFEEMRVRIGKPLTELARKLAVKRLREVCELGLTPEEVIYESVLNNWPSFYPPRDMKPKHSTATVGMNRGEWRPE